MLTKGFQRDIWYFLTPNGGNKGLPRCRVIRPGAKLIVSIRGSFSLADGMAFPRILRADMSATWTTYVIGPVYTLLPRRWRARDRHGSGPYLARAAMISGIGEGVLSLLALSTWYMNYFGMLGDKYVDYVVNARGEPFAWESVSHAGFFAFIMHPLTWLILYFGVEGTLRTFAALSTGEVYGTVPLWGLEWIYRLAMRRRPRAELPLVRDEVTGGGSAYDMRIYSCRRRSEWRYPFTIRYGGAYFQVIDEKFIDAGPRPYAYSLRRLPPGEVARGLAEYDPEDVLVPVHRVESLA